MNEAFSQKSICGLEVGNNLYPEILHNRMNALLGESTFPGWFTKLLERGQLLTIIDQIYVRQMIFANFSSTDLNHIRQWKLPNMNFYHNNEGLADKELNTRGYYVPLGNKVESYVSFQTIFRALSQGNTSHNDSLIGIYPGRIDSEMSLMAVLSHEISHYFFDLKILFDFKNTDRATYLDYKNWSKMVYTDRHEFARLQFINEALAFYNGGSAGFHYGDMGSEHMYKNAGNQHTNNDVYGAGAKFGSQMLKRQVDVYNYLAYIYGLDTSKPPGFQLPNSANHIFQYYARTVCDLVYRGLWDRGLFGEVISVIGDNKKSIQELLMYIESKKSSL